MARASPLLRLSAIAVAASGLAAAAGLASIASGALWHPWLLGAAGLVVLPSALHPVLLAGLAARGWSRGPAGVAGGLAGLLALLAVPLGLAGLEWRVPAAASMLLQALLAAHAGLRWWGRRGEPWWPWAAPPLLGLAGLALSDGGCWGLASAALLYAAPMIAVVTLYTTGRNYGVRPATPLAAAMLAPAAASAALLAAGAPQWHAPAALTPIIASAALRPWRLLSAGRPQLRGVAWLHSTWPLAGAAWLYKALAAGLLGSLHGAALAFALPTVLLHAPLLAPQLIPVKVRPPATPMAYLAAVAAALLWPGTAATLLLAASLAAWLLEVRPAPRLSPRGGKG